MCKTWVSPLGWEDPLEEGMAYPVQYSCLENPCGQRTLAGYSRWGRKKLDMTERLSTFLKKIWKIKCSKLFGHCESFYEQINPEIWTQFFHSNWHLGLDLLSLDLLLLDFGRKIAIWEHWKDNKEQQKPATGNPELSVFKLCRQPLLSRWWPVIRTAMTQNFLPPPRDIRRNNRNSCFFRVGEDLCT